MTPGRAEAKGDADGGGGRGAETAPTLRDRLDDGRVHVMDGAMGTLLYERGVFLNVCYDDLSRTEPALVEGIHWEYAMAGARILETNTFGANPVKLSSFGLQEHTEAINRAAAERARAGIAAAGIPGVLAVGAFGPLGIRIEPWGPTAEAEAEAYFGRQVDGLIEGGVDGFLLETFQDLAELRQALRAVRARSALPVIAQVTIEEGGRTAYGTSVERVVRTLEEWGADAVGVNCSVGPAEMLDAVERMAAVTDLPLAAQPNAGLPRSVGDRTMYLASPEYMARYARRMVEAGARFVGGCCGTTPEHIRAIVEALQAPGPRSDAPRRPVPSATAVSVGEDRSSPGPKTIPGEQREPVPLGERSPLGRKLATGGFVTSVELVPPRGWDPAPLLADARRVRLAGADLVTIPDTPRGHARMSALPAASLVRQQTGLEVLPHYACRDRNMLGMISDLMGAAATGVRNVLVITGELLRTGPYPDHTAVFDIDSIGLTNVIHRLNRGADPGGHPVEPATEFVVGVALNQGAEDLEREHRRFHWKVEAGAEFAVTQPVFDPDELSRFIETAGAHGIPIMAGVWPLDSLRSAEFLANEVPGVKVPGPVIERMRAAEAKGEDAAREEGVRIAVEAAEALLPKVGGIQVSSSRGGIELALEVIARVQAKIPRIIAAR